MEADLLDRITTNPRILGSKPVGRGMRVSVEQIVKALAAGVPAEDPLADIPVLEQLLSTRYEIGCSGPVAGRPRGRGKPSPVRRTASRRLRATDFTSVGRGRRGS